MDTYEAMKVIEEKLRECIIPGIEGAYPEIEKDDVYYLTHELRAHLSIVKASMSATLEKDFFKTEVDEVLFHAAALAEELCDTVPTLGGSGDYWSTYKDWLLRVAELMKLLADAMRPHHMRLSTTLRIIASWLLYIWKFT
jgi:hypothetical protein